MPTLKMSTFQFTAFNTAGMEIFTGWAETNWTKVLVTVILVVFQLLSGFCLKHFLFQQLLQSSTMLVNLWKIVTVDPHNYLWLLHRRKRFVIVVYFKMAPQGDNRVKVSALLHAIHKVSEVANLAGVSRTTVLAIIEAHELWRRYQQTCRQWSKDCCGSWQLARCHSRDCFYFDITVTEYCVG